MPSRDLAVAIQGGGGEQHRHERDRLRQRDHREEPDVHERGAPPGADLRVAARLVGVDRLPLAPERLDHAHAREPFLQRGQRLGDAVADRVVGAARAVVEGPARRRSAPAARSARRARASARGSRARPPSARSAGRCRSTSTIASRRNSSSACTSEVSRETSTPVRSCSKNPSGSACSFSKAAARSRFRKRSLRGRGQQRLRAHDQRLQRREHEQRDRGHVERVQVVLDDPVVDRVADERRAGERDQRRDDHGRGRAEVEPLHRPREAAGLAPDLARWTPAPSCRALQREQLAVAGRARAAAPRACPARRCDRPRAPRRGRRARSSPAGARSRASCGPRITSASAARISCSLVASTAEVASSRTSTAGSARIARAIAIRCRWPPESEKPRSPRIVS